MRGDREQSNIKREFTNRVLRGGREGELLLLREELSGF